jgi:hypothetical protein
MNKLLFLTSTRFWALVAIAIVGVLDAEGILSSPIAQALVTILGGFVVVRTIDRNIGDAMGGLK